MTKLTIWFEPRDKLILVTSWAEIMSPWPLFQNTFIIRRPRVAIFAGIIKIMTMFIKKIFKYSKIIKRISNYIPKSNLYLYFSIKQILPISGEKCSCQQKSTGVSLDSYIFWIFFRQGLTVSSLIIAEYVRQILGRGLFGFPICEQPRKGPSWLGLNLSSVKSFYSWKWFKWE